MSWGIGSACLPDACAACQSLWLRASPGTAELLSSPVFSSLVRRSIHLFSFGLHYSIKIDMVDANLPVGVLKLNPWCLPYLVVKVAHEYVGRSDAVSVEERAVTVFKASEPFKSLIVRREVERIVVGHGSNAPGRNVHGRVQRVPLRDYRGPCYDYWVHRGY